MALRGSGITASSSNSWFQAWPAGTAAGDLAVLFGTEGGGNIAVPATWTTLYLNNSGLSIWRAMAASKVLTSGDISAGGVTVTSSGSFDGVVAIATFVGGAGGILETDVNFNGNLQTPTPNVVTSSGSVLSSYSALYFGSVRDSSGTVVINRGTLLQSALIANAAAKLMLDTALPGGAYSTNFTYSAGNTNVSFVIVVQSGGVGAARPQPMMFIAM